MICGLCGDGDCDCKTAIGVEGAPVAVPDGSIMQRPHKFLADPQQPDRCQWCKRFHGDDDVEAP